MPKAKKSGSKKGSKPYGKKGGKSSAPADKSDPMFPARPKNFRIGGDIRVKTNLSRFVKWPRYVRLQRQRKILTQRLKVPPAINQFTRALTKDQATELFALLQKHKPEDKQAKKERIRAAAQAKADGAEAPAPTKNFNYVQFGLNHITYLVEQKKASLVVIASDVDPIELVVWLPALCKKMDVPYCIVKNKSRLGALVGFKTATCVAVTTVDKSSTSKLEKLQDMCRNLYNNNTEANRTWGGGQMGLKTQERLRIRENLRKAEAAKKAMY